MTDTAIERFMTFVDTTSDPNGCWLWTGSKTVKGGYGQFSLNRRPVRAHRFSYEITKGAIPTGMIIRHMCRGKCVNPDHLELGTFQDNMNDRQRDGTNGNKLTKEQVVAIRNRINTSCTEIAKEYGVNKTTISSILLRKIWKHV